MQTPIDPQQRDKEATNYLYESLRRLPHDIEGIEAIIAVMLNAKREATARLDDAELNATFAAPQDGRNAEQREMQRKQAIAQSVEYQSARKEVMSLEDELEQREVEVKALRREFQAAIALAELHAARINLMAKLQTSKEIK